MTPRAIKAMDVLKSGGYFRRQLETQYRGGEKFCYRLRDKAGAVIKGIGFQTFSELEKSLTTRSCPSSTVWPTEWILWEGRS